ncbi:hypothetical protein p2A69 (plasmid) [Aromatoleum aromaticum EbN1]|uniref:Uncharacterized protein n=1 Tax=Aromatoleum aromaticum (strain DSM 19018 / LMG 30748 / EbN1) TaxID=76114 RepID=Q5NWJ9_AROAE|nr:hypothetical protein p2A69 [Aromatoleum aromaticum EbN1]
MTRPREQGTRSDSAAAEARNSDRGKGASPRAAAAAGSSAAAAGPPREAPPRRRALGRDRGVRSRAARDRPARPPRAGRSVGRAARGCRWPHHRRSRSIAAAAARVPSARPRAARRAHRRAARSCSRDSRAARSNRRTSSAWRSSRCWPACARYPRFARSGRSIRGTRSTGRSGASARSGQPPGAFPLMRRNPVSYPARVAFFDTSGALRRRALSAAEAREIVFAVFRRFARFGKNVRHATCQPLKQGRPSARGFVIGVCLSAPSHRSGKPVLRRNRSRRRKSAVFFREAARRQRATDSPAHRSRHGFVTRFAARHGSGATRGGSTDPSSSGPIRKCMKTEVRGWRGLHGSTPDSRRCREGRYFGGVRLRSCSSRGRGR